MQMKKRVLSAFMALCMVCSLVGAAWAVIPRVEAASPINSTVDTIAQGVDITLFDYDASHATMENKKDNINGTNAYTYHGNAQHDEDGNPYHYTGNNSTTNFVFTGSNSWLDANNSNRWWNYWTTKGGGVVQGIVQSQLNKNGNPVLNTVIKNEKGQDLDYLFDTTSNDYKTVYQNLNHLFQYNESTGYYTFDSQQNFATIKDVTPTQRSDGTYEYNFQVYDQGNTGTSQGSSKHPYFMPFNKFGINETDSEANYHFGMKITANS